MDSKFKVEGGKHKIKLSPCKGFFAISYFSVTKKKTLVDSVRCPRPNIIIAIFNQMTKVDWMDLLRFFYIYFYWILNVFEYLHDLERQTLI